MYHFSFRLQKIQKDFTVLEINPFALLTLSENQWLPYPRNIAVCEVYTYQQGYRPPIILNQCLHLCNSVLAVAAFANISGSRFPLMPTWLKSHTKFTFFLYKTYNLYQQVRSANTFTRCYSLQGAVRITKYIVPITITTFSQP